MYCIRRSLQHCHSSPETLKEDSPIRLPSFLLYPLGGGGGGGGGGESLNGLSGHEMGREGGKRNAAVWQGKVYKKMANKKNNNSPAVLFYFAATERDRISKVSACIL